MANCIHCSNEVDEAYNFCVECEGQVKCAKCSSYLLKDKSKCLICGTPVVVTESIATVAINTLKIKESQTGGRYSLEVDLALTNEGMEKAAPFFNSVSIPTPRSKSRTLHVIPSQQLPLPIGDYSSTGNELHNISSENEELASTAIIVEPSSQQRNNDGNKPDDFFEKGNKGHLILTTPDLKASSKKDQTLRFCILYVWAYNIIFDSPVPNKEHMNSASKLNSLYDKNFSTYFSALAKVNFVQSDGTYKLNANGNKYLKTILEQVNNDNIKGYNPTSTPSKHKVRSAQIDNDTQNNIAEWITKNSRFNSFDIRKADTRIKLCILPFYDLIHELKVVDSVSTAAAYEFLVRKFKTINIDKTAFRKVVTGKSYGKYFEKTSDSKYYVTAEADKLAESMIMI